MIRKCSKCGKPGLFYPRKDRKSGFCSQCACCQRARSRAYQEAHPEGLVVRSAAARRWAVAHPDEQRVGILAAKAARPEYYRMTGLAATRAWRRAHPEFDRNKSRRRRALKAGTAAELTGEEWLAILEYFNHACAYCLRADLPLQQEHVIALARGGEHIAENVVPACGHCNARKRAKPVFVMVSASSLRLAG
jgi:5-methylcytosine-specific restriction endonuclease McrA